MGEELATAFVEVRPVAAGFGAQLDTQLQPQLAATEGRLSRMFGSGSALAASAKGLAVGLVGSEVVTRLISTADAASDLNEEVSKSSVVFGDAADEVLDWSSTSAAALQLSQRAALQAVGVYGDFFNTLGVGDQVGAQLGERLVEVASDVASFKNVAGGAEDVSSRFFRALTGERESLKELGIVITELDVATKATSLGFERQNGQFSQGAKALATYELILEKTRDAQGDVARTGGEFAGQTRELNANMEDLAASIGGLVVPGLAELATNANAAIGPLSDLIGLLDVDIGDSTLFGSVLSGAAVGLAGPLGLVGQLVGEVNDEFFATEGAAAGAESSTTSLASVLGGQLDGALSAVTGGLDDAGAAARQFQDDIDSVSDAFFGSMDAEASYADALRSIEEAQEGVARSQRSLSDARAGVTDAERELAEAVRDQAAAQDEARLAVERADRALQAAERSAARARRTYDDLLEDQAEAQRIFDHALATFGPDSKRTQDAGEELEDVNDRVAAAQDSVTDAQERVDDAARSQRDAQEGLTAALNGTDDASQRVRDAQDGVEDAHRRVADAASAVEAAERRVGEATDNAARAAIEAEIALRDQQAALRDHPEAAAGFLEFLDTVAAKRPEVSDTLQQWKRDLEDLGVVLNTPLIDLTGEGTVAEFLMGMANGTWTGSNPQNGGVSDLLGGVFGAAAAPSAPSGGKSALADLGAKTGGGGRIEINVNGVPDLHTRAMLQDTIEEAVRHIADRQDDLVEVRS